MILMTITQISKGFNISARALRYYEQIGLLSSQKKEDYAYRTYDETSVRRLQQIIVLRKLRIPLKQISEILINDDVSHLIDVFLEKIKEINDEVTALSTIRAVLQTFISSLQKNTEIKLDMLQDNDIIKIIDSLSLSKINFKEKRSMEELNKANQSLSKLQDKDVRIIYLPPMTIASVHITNGECANQTIPVAEEVTGKLVADFVKDTKLDKVKPDFRHFGFNHPDGASDTAADHGYERWLTIPDTMEVKAPFTKKQFEGGLYAAHMIPMGAFEEWQWLVEWAQNNEKYEPNWSSVTCDGGCMEEHLNYFSFSQMDAKEQDTFCLQLDLLVPIKEKN